MIDQAALVKLLGKSRFQPYLDESKKDEALDESKKDEALACDLYMWATQLAGAFHSQLSFVEIALRNSLDSCIKVWNRKQGYPEDWTGKKDLAEPLYSLIGKEIREARKRSSSNVKKGDPPTHDDVIAQLMFGTWVKIIYVKGNNNSNSKQQKLWRDGLYQAFQLGSDDSQREKIGKTLHRLRHLRNRIAHHENLLRVKIQDKIDQIYSVLTAIDPDYQKLAHSQSTLRELKNKDPRRRV